MEKCNNLVIPNRVWFSLTGVCNNSCKWCYRSGSEIKEFIDTALVFKITDVLLRCGTKKCTVIGGEPTLHPDYKRIVDYLVAKMTSCTFVTNGRKLSYDIPRSWPVDKKLHVTMSLHGADKKHYQDNTGSEIGFNQTVNAIKWLVSKKIKHSVNVVLSKENLPYIKDFVRLVFGLGVDMLCFTMAISSVDDSNYQTDPIELSMAVAGIHELCNKINQPHLFIFSLPWCLLDGKLLDNLIRQRQLIFNCPIDSGRGIVVKENGALAVCTHLSSYEILPREKTKEVFSTPDNFIKFWNSPEMISFRRTVNVYRDKRCFGCRYRLYCKGGCPLWWKNYDFRKILQKKGG